jgi:hypothetical protein
VPYRSPGCRRPSYYLGTRSHEGLLERRLCPVDGDESAIAGDEMEKRKRKRCWRAVVFWLGKPGAWQSHLGL